MKKNITVSTNDGIYKYSENNTWEIDNGYLRINDEEGNTIAHYNIGQWNYIRKE